MDEVRTEVEIPEIIRETKNAAPGTIRRYIAPCPGCKKPVALDLVPSKDIKGEDKDACLVHEGCGEHFKALIFLINPDAKPDDPGPPPEALKHLPGYG